MVPPSEARTELRRPGLMFAKFSPDATRVAYVQANNIYVERLDTGKLTAAHDGRFRNDHQRNVRLGLRGRALPARLLSLEPRRPSHRVLAVRYDWRRDLLADRRHVLAVSDDFAHPVSESRDDQLRCRASGSSTLRAARLAGCKPRTILETAISPASNGSMQSTVGMQQLNRLQNRNDFLARRRAKRRGLTDSFATSRRRGSRSMEDIIWIDEGRAFLWISERDGWRHVYRVPRPRRPRNGSNGEPGVRVGNSRRSSPGSMPT